MLPLFVCFTNEVRRVEGDLSGVPWEALQEVRRVEVAATVDYNYAGFKDEVMRVSLVNEGRRGRGRHG